MAARSWLLLLLVLAGAALQPRAQPSPDSSGFVSIDCGLPERGSGYVDAATKLPYVPDGAFTDAGSNHNVSAEYMTASLSRRYLNVRSFPGAARSCYTIPLPSSAAAPASSSKYLVRATFLYGNYDGLDTLPVFDLHLGVNFWQTVNVTTPDKAQMAEAVAVVPAGESAVQVCLVDTGSGTPFVSGLDLRPLWGTLYPQANATQALVLVDRSNFGVSGLIVLRELPRAFRRAADCRRATQRLQDHPVLAQPRLPRARLRRVPLLRRGSERRTRLGQRWRTGTKRKAGTMVGPTQGADG
jgi:hypothetical protein